MKGLNINRTVKISQFEGEEYELIHARIERLLFVGLMDQVGSLDQGSRLPDYLDDKATEATVLAMMDEIKFLIKTYEPLIVLDAVGVDLVPTESSIGAIIYIKCHSTKNPNQEYILEYIKVREV